MLNNFLTPQLDRIGQCIPDLLLVLNTDGLVVFANRGRGSLSQKQLIGKRLHELLFSNQSDAADVMLAEILLTGKSGRLEVTSPSAEGTRSHVQRFVAIEEDGSIVGVLVVETDVTERLKLAEEVELERAKVQHVNKFTTLGEMASGMAVELGAPLAKSQTLLSMLRERIESGTLDPRDALGIVSELEKSTRRMTKTVESLRTLSHDNDAETFMPHPIAAILTESMNLLGEKMRLGGVELRSAPVPAELMIECRSSQIAQILLNLCNNALNVILESPERWLQIDVKDLGLTVEISITDSGVSVPKESREKLIKPEGTGLGLSVSKDIASAHHGLLYLDQAAVRTRFILLLPKRQPTSSAA